MGEGVKSGEESEHARARCRGKKGAGRRVAAARTRRATSHADSAASICFVSVAMVLALAFSPPENRPSCDTTTETQKTHSLSHTTIKEQQGRER